MNHPRLICGLWIVGATVFSARSVSAQDKGYRELKGTWQAAELVDNGKVIPTEAIPGWLPSGGRIEIVDNSIVFTSPKDGERYARVFSLDAAVYPRQINLMDDGKISAQGIYQIDNGRLVVCLVPASVSPRPTDFSAREGSQRVMIVFARSDSKNAAPPTSAQSASAQSASAKPPLNLPAPPANPPVHAAARPITDGEIKTLLPGTWKFNDAYGAFFLSLDKNGTFATYRETVETSAFQKVFKKMPLSSGTWKLKNGQVVLQCTSSVYADRLCKTFPFTIRAVTSTDLQFVDYAGNAGKAVRTQI
jgi:uncharacterized protein (TIGR03067 family)